MNTKQHRRIRISCAALVATVALAASCAGPEKKVVARAGDRKVTVGDVVLQYRTMSVNVRPFVETLEGKRNFVNDMINKEIMLDEAAARGLDKSPDLARAVEQFESMTLAEKYYAVNIREKVNVTEASLRDMYDKMTEQVQLRLAFFTTEEKAREAHALLKGGADFAAVARERSEDAASSVRGGDMGLKPWAEYPPELIAAAKPLKDNQLSDIIPTQGGFAVVRIEARQVNPLQDFETEKANLLSRMRTAEENRLAAEWTAAKQAEVHVEIDPDGAAVLLESMKAAQGRRLQFKGQAAYEIAEPMMEHALARFAGRTWTLREYLARLSTIAAERRPALTSTPEALAAFIRDFALREVAIDEARKSGLADLPEVTSAVQRFREKQIVTLLHVQIGKVDSIPAADIARYYDEHQASLIAPAAARIVPAVFATEDQARAALKRVRQQTTTMKEVAEKESIDRASAAMGEEGVLVPRSADPTPLEKVVFSTEAKRVGGPVKTDKGWTIFRVMDKSGEVPMTLQQAEPVIRQKLAEETSMRQFDEWLAGERERRKIKLDEKVLASIDFGTRARAEDAAHTEGSAEPTPVGGSRGDRSYTRKAA